jgi:hypothetical protein
MCSADNVLGGFITLLLCGIGFFLTGSLFLMIAEDYLDSKKKRNKRNAKSCNCRH